MNPFAKLIPKAARTSLYRLLSKHSLMMSQAGQDFWVYGEAFNEMKGGYFVDVGAYDGFNVSNTYLLESKYHWSGICIEANPLVFKRLERSRRSTNLNICLDRSEGEADFLLRDAWSGIVDEDVDNTKPDADAGSTVKLRTMSLNRVFEDHHVPSVVDYLSIDVEGAEERILADFDFGKYTFRCMTIERPTAPLRALLKDRGYTLIKEIPRLDCFYIHEDFLERYWENLFAFHAKKHLSIRWR